MASQVEEKVIGSPASPYWWWLLLALAFHAVLFLGLNTKLIHPAELNVSSGENALDVSLEADQEPSSPPVTPSPIPTPLTQPTPDPLPVEQPVLPKPDDIVVPKVISSPISTPTPPPLPLTPKPSEYPHPKPPTHFQPTHHDIIRSTEHHERLHGGETGSAGDGKASYLDNPKPPYPESARDAQEEGTVELMVSVDESGRVTNVSLLRSSGTPDLDQSALQTVRTHWKFRPGHSAGIAITSQVIVPIHFYLNE